VPETSSGHRDHADVAGVLAEPIQQVMTKNQQDKQADQTGDGPRLEAEATGLAGQNTVAGSHEARVAQPKTADATAGKVAGTSFESRVVQGGTSH
jgi:hypothetical protein